MKFIKICYVEILKKSSFPLKCQTLIFNNKTHLKFSFGAYNPDNSAILYGSENFCSQFVATFYFCDLATIIYIVFIIPIVLGYLIFCCHCVAFCREWCMHLVNLFAPIFTIFQKRIKTISSLPC